MSAVFVELSPVDGARDKYYVVAARWNLTLNITNSTYDHFQVVSWDPGQPFRNDACCENR